MAFRLPKMFNCYAASEMTSRRQSSGKLNFYDRFMLAAHLLMCSGCRFVERQFALIDAVSRRAGAIMPSDTAAERDADRLPEKAKDKLRKIIR